MPLVSSTIVAVPVAETVPVFVAVNMIVSPLSGVASAVIATRTNKVVPVVGIRAKLLAV